MCRNRSVSSQASTCVGIVVRSTTVQGCYSRKYVHIFFRVLLFHLGNSRKSLLNFFWPKFLSLFVTPHRNGALILLYYYYQPLLQLVFLAHAGKKKLHVSFFGQHGSFTYILRRNPVILFFVPLPLPSLASSLFREKVVKCSRGDEERNNRQ